MLSIIYVFMNKNRIYSSGIRSLFFLIGIFYLYMACISPNLITGLGLYSLTFVITAGVILLPNRDKLDFLRFISRFTAVLLLISIIAWGMYLVGISLPYTYKVNFEDNFHSYINYYFFLLVDREVSILPRFNSFFIEPGQMASVCVLLLFANLKINKNKFDIIILLLALILSFSLAGWCVFAIGLILYSLTNPNRPMLKFLGIISLLFFMYSLSQNTEEDSVINTYILHRLQFDADKGIVGNNRSHEDFEIKFSKYIESDNIWTGIHKDLTKGYNWTTGNAGYKVYIVINGIIGFALIIFILIRYTYMYNNIEAWIYLFCFLLLCFIRSFFHNPYWLYMLILVIPLLFNKQRLISNG